jgi:hypothetical protein
VLLQEFIVNMCTVGDAIEVVRDIVVASRSAMSLEKLKCGHRDMPQRFHRELKLRKSTWPEGRVKTALDLVGTHVEIVRPSVCGRSKSNPCVPTREIEKFNECVHEVAIQKKCDVLLLVDVG